MNSNSNKSLALKAGDLNEAAVYALREAESDVANVLDWRRWAERNPAEPSFPRSAEVYRVEALRNAGLALRLRLAFAAAKSPFTRVRV